MKRTSIEPFTRNCWQVARMISAATAFGAVILAAQHGIDFFVTADQRGQRLMNDERYSEAAETFSDPYRQGVACYRAGDYEQAAKWFDGLPSAEASFNQGNALVMLGKYDDAVVAYDRALQMRPDWKAATANREIALGRSKRMDFEGGDMTGGKMEADGITFDKSPSSSEQTETIDGGEEPSDEALRAIWLRQVQTTPSDFLQAKFAYQKAMSDGGGNE